MHDLNKQQPFLHKENILKEKYSEHNLAVKKESIKRTLPDISA